MERFKLMDFFKPCDDEVALKKAYKQASGGEQKRLYKELKAFRGIRQITSTDDNGITTTNDVLSEIIFVEYIFKSFKVINIADSLLFYNWHKHCYEFIKPNTYLGWFKKLLDYYSKKIWNSSVESRYHSRFLRDIPVRLKEWYIPEDVVVFNNGYFNTATGTFTPGDHPDDIYNRCCTGYDYDPTATCEKFVAFINDVFNEDKDIIAVAQEMMGYTLAYSCTKLHVITLCLGYGRNGKGVLVNILTKVHGEDNVSKTSISHLNDRFGLGDLSSKVLNVSDENVEGVVADTSVLKNISGAGSSKVMVEKKFIDAIPTRITCKLWVVSNDISFADSSRGFEERVVPLFFKNTYTSSPLPNTNQRLRNNNLEEELSDPKELAGVFNWAYEGLVRLRNNQWKITESEEVTKQRALIVEGVNPVKLFVKHMVTPMKDVRTYKPDVFKKFKEFVTANNLDFGTCATAVKFYPKFAEELRNASIYPVETKRYSGLDCYTSFTVNTTTTVL